MVSEQTADVARRAKQLYEDKLRAKLEVTTRNDFLAIEPDSGEYFFGKTLSEAIEASRAAYPTRLAFAMRVGHGTAVNIGVLSS
jgi:hypothetical protein